jgi:hypothetical protein
MLFPRRMRFSTCCYPAVRVFYHYWPGVLCVYAFMRFSCVSRFVFTFANLFRCDFRRAFTFEPALVAAVLRGRFALLFCMGIGLYDAAWFCWAPSMHLRVTFAIFMRHW